MPGNDEANDKPLSVSDTLQRHNDRVLLESAQRKLKEGKKLSREERLTVSRVEASRASAAAMPYLTAMPKGAFLELFGGSSKVYIDWRKRDGFPWPIDKDVVDVIAIVRWCRQRTVDVNTSAGRDDADHDQRLKAAKADLAELELAKRRGEVVTLADLLADVGMFGDKMREGIELIGRLNPECQQIMMAKVTEAEQDFEHGHRIVEDSEASGADAPDSEESPEASA